jgi:hypothetical protein
MKNPTPNHYDPTCMRYWFRKVPSSDIPEETVRSAAEALSFFSQDLQIADLSPRIAWIQPEEWTVAAKEYEDACAFARKTGTPFSCDCTPIPATDFDGYVTGESTQEILIRTCCLHLPWTIAHELRHLYQKKISGSRVLDGEGSESDARSYADEALNRFTGTQCHRVKTEELRSPFMKDRMCSGE